MANLYYGSLEHTAYMEKLHHYNILQSVNNSTTFRYVDKVVQELHPKHSVNITVENMTTTEAIKHFKGYAALNFASYKFPGGGFRKVPTCLAQEEYICKDSFLFNVLSHPKFKIQYEWNRAHLNNGLYTNWCIFSKDVGFVDVKGDIVATADIITCAAPNANKYRNKVHDECCEHNIDRAMHQRIGFLLAVAKKMGVKNIILGAFGCGVFGNDPMAVASIFYNHLLNRNYGFENVVFAIPGGTNYEVFKNRLEDFLKPDNEEED